MNRRSGPGYIQYMNKKRTRREFEQPDSDYDSELEEALIKLEKEHRIKKRFFGRRPKKPDTYLIKPISQNFMKFVRIPGTPPSPDIDIEYYSEDEPDFLRSTLYHDEEDDFSKMFQPSPDPEFDDDYQNSIEEMIREADSEINEQSATINSLVASRRPYNSPSWHTPEEEEFE